MKRLFLLLAMCLLVSCASKPVKTPITLTIGVNDPLAKKSACDCAWDTASRLYEPMIAEVGKETGIKLIFDYHGESLSLTDDIKKGKYDGYITKTWAGLNWAKDSKRDCKAIAELTRKSGKSELYGLFIALSDGPLKSLKDIEGKRVAYGKAGGYEKHHLVKQTLDALKVKPKAYIETPACMTALIDLHDGKADVAAISDYAMVTSCISSIFPIEDFKIIGETKDRIPFVSFFVDTKKVPADVRANLTRILTKMTGKNTPKEMNCSGWLPVSGWNPEL